MALFISSVTLLPPKCFEEGVKRDWLHHQFQVHGCLCVVFVSILSIHFTLYPICGIVSGWMPHHHWKCAYEYSVICKIFKPLTLFRWQRRHYASFPFFFRLPSLQLSLQSYHISSRGETFIFAMSVLHDKYLCENIHHQFMWILYKECNIPIWMGKGRNYVKR